MPRPASLRSLVRTTLAVWLVGCAAFLIQNRLSGQEKTPAPAAPTPAAPAPGAPAPAAPANAVAVKAALVGQWSVDKDSLRDAILSDFKRNDQPIADEVVKLVGDLVDKSTMTLDFRADGSMTATAKIVSPIGPSEESVESGTWKIVGMKDNVATLETTTKAEKADEPKVEQVELSFDDGDRIHVKIPAQKAQFKFRRVKK